MSGSISIRSSTRNRAGVTRVALAVPLVLSLSIFGFFGWFVCPAVLAAGLVGRMLSRRWALWALWIGAGLVLGAIIYIMMGLLAPDGPGSMPMTHFLVTDIPEVVP